MVFKAETTLVLGAGANVGYGYPTGDGLIDCIIEQSKADAAKGDKVAARLKEMLEYYDPRSIDSFLLHNQEKEIISYAKTQIAFCLLKAERPDVYRRGQKDKDGNLVHWYRFLWDAIISGTKPSSFDDQNADLKFNIITFNYDKSIEYFLYSRIERASHLDDRQKLNFANNIRGRVHHVYGVIQDEKLLTKTEGMTPNYGTQNEEEYLILSEAKKCGRKINLIDERESRHTEERYKGMKNILSESEVIIFLGFGFDDVNIGPKVLDVKSAFRYRGTGIRSDAAYQLNGVKWPIIKYTNYGNSMILDKKIEYLSANHELTVNKNSGDEKLLLTLPKENIIKSTKMVYEALNQDFLLNLA